MESKITSKVSIHSLWIPESTYIIVPQTSSHILYVTRTGKEVALLNLSFYEPENTSRAFNEVLLLLTRPSLDYYFRNSNTGRLKENVIFVIDNGPSEAPSSPLVHMWLSRLLEYLKLDRISQISFAEYHSRRNFVERVHAAENKYCPKLCLIQSRSMKKQNQGATNTKRT